MLFIGWWIN